MAPPLVLIPGLLNDADLWRDQVAALSGRTRCVVADITQGETLEALAQAVLGMAGERFALAGFSLGGYVAQEVVRIAPDRVAGLMLLDTSIRADTPKRAASRTRVIEAARVAGRFHGFGRTMLAAYLGPGQRDDPKLLARIRGMAERLGPAVLARQSTIERRDGGAVLRGLRCPLVVACGEHDTLTPMAEHQAMLAYAPQARLVVIPESGHMTPIENPAAVSAALSDLLDSIPP